MKLYQHKDRYSLITHHRLLYELLSVNGKYIPKKVGKVGKDYIGNGTLLRKIPNSVKRICFDLNRKI